MKDMVDSIKATSDIMVRVLLGQEENIPLLTDFVNAVLTDQGFKTMKRLTLKNPINMRSVFYEKETVLDVRAEDEKGRIYDVEIQGQGSREFVHRSLYYWSKLYSGQLETGSPYKKLNPVICINLMNYILFPEDGNEDYHSCFMTCKLGERDVILSDHMQIHYIELPKFPLDLSHIPQSRLQKWSLYFKGEGNLEEEDMKILLKDDDMLEKAHRTFQKFTADELLRERYEARMKFKRDQASFMEEAREKGLEEGREEGREKGLIEAKRQVASDLKKNGISIDLIQGSTGLSREEIDEL